MEAEWPTDKDTLSKAQERLQSDVVERWWQLADELIARFSDGVYTHRNSSKSMLGYTAWWLQMIGYNQEFYKVQWVQHSMLPPPMLWSELSWFHMAAASDLAGTVAENVPAGMVFGFVIGAVVGAVGVAAAQQRRKTSDLSRQLL